MSATPKKIRSRLKRKKRIRKKVLGTTERPRLSVFRSNKHIYVQVIDDASGRTLASASTLSPELQGQLDGLKKLDQAKKVGELAAKKCIDGGFDKVVFDRNGYIYTGRVAAVASAARETGLKF